MPPTFILPISFHGQIQSIAGDRQVHMASCPKRLAYIVIKKLSFIVSLNKNIKVKIVIDNICK